MRIFLALLTLGLAGCSLKTMALRQTAALMETGASAYLEESDPVLAREALASQLKLTEGLLKNDPRDPKLLLLAAQGYAGYAFLFLEDKEPRRAKDFYLRGRAYGARLLERNKALSAVLTTPLDELEKNLQAASKADVPALFWTAYALAGWVNLSRDSAEAVADLPRAAALMQRVHQLQPQYNFAGADLFFGVYFASRPKILGGDPERAKTHFEWARRINGGDFLTAYLLEARYYAVAVQDQAHFKSLLERVRDAPAGTLPDSRLADEVAKQKAVALLEKTDELF